MTYQGRIVSDYKIMLGKPVIKGTRITVELIIRKLSEGATVGDLLEAYPSLNADDIYACLSYASEVISEEQVIAPAE